MQRLKERARTLYPIKDSAHDWNHVLRVVANCSRLVAKEGGDAEILFPAALLHDVVHLPDDHPQAAEVSVLSARAAKMYLAAEFSRDEIVRITTVIEEHNAIYDPRPSTHEGALLQDAVRLDTIGAIGVLRAARIFGGAADSTRLAAHAPTQFQNLRQVEFKLRQLALGMNTLTARRLAEARIAHTQIVLAQFAAECHEV